MKKVLSIILCAVVCIAMLPAGAFAAAQVSAPKSLTAKVTENKTVTVSWSKAAGAKGYKIYRAESRYNENYRYTSYKCIKTVTSKSTVKYTDKTVKPGKKYYYKVKAYKVTGGKNKYSGYTKVKSAYVEPESWTIERLEKDLISYLTEKGYTVRAVDMGAKYGQEWYDSHRANANGDYKDDYNRVLNKIKKEALEEAAAIEESYKAEGPELVSYSIAIGIDVIDGVNPYGVSLDGARVFVVDDGDAEYDYPDLDEATKQQYIARILELVNQERAKAGVAPLTLNQKLCDMAAFKLNEMDELHYYGHKSPVYGTPSEMAKAFGITDRGCGENLAGVSTPDEAMEGWLSSEGHRANILNPRYTQIGIGVHISSDYGTKTFIQQFIY